MQKLEYTNDHTHFKYAKGNIDIYGQTFHSYYEIYLLLNGNVEFTNKHTRQRLQPYQLIIIPPGEYHQFVILDDVNQYERCILEIYPEHFYPDTDILRNALAGKEMLNLPSSHRIIQHFLYLKECISSGTPNDFRYILSAIATDLVFLIKKQPGPPRVLPGSLHPLSLEMIHFIDEHYTDSLDLNYLSQKLHFSVSSLCHIFKENFGISIKKYILQKRINAAHLALLEGEHPENVYSAFGFSSYSSFYRAYKNHFGCSPSEAFKMYQSPYVQ